MLVCMAVCVCVCMLRYAHWNTGAQEPERSPMGTYMFLDCPRYIHRFHTVCRLLQRFLHGTFPCHRLASMLSVAMHILPQLLTVSASVTNCCSYGLDDKTVSSLFTRSFMYTLCPASSCCSRHQ